MPEDEIPCDSELTYTALCMYANWIETHNTAISRNDAIAAGEHKKIRHLDTHQLKMVERIRLLAERILRKNL